MITKDELIQQISNDETFKAVVDQMKADQRAQSQEFVKNFVSQLYDSLVPGLQQVMSNPQAADALQKALISGGNVVMPEADAERPEPKDPGHG